MFGVLPFLVIFFLVPHGTKLEALHFHKAAHGNRTFRELRGADIAGQHIRRPGAFQCSKRQAGVDLMLQCQPRQSFSREDDLVGEVGNGGAIFAEDSIRGTSVTE